MNDYADCAKTFRAVIDAYRTVYDKTCELVKSKCKKCGLVKPKCKTMPCDLVAPHKVAYKRNIRLMEYYQGIRDRVTEYDGLMAKRDASPETKGISKIKALKLKNKT